MTEIDGLQVRPSIMAAQVAAMDWSETPLGPIAAWPAELRVAAQLCLDAPFPATLGWGEDLILIYNDGYIPIMGAKHPGLGRPALEVYAELADFIGPIVRAALDRGETYTEADRPLPMQQEGQGGGLRERYFDLWYGPVRDAQGRIQGVLANANETTPRVLSERRQRTVLAVAEALVEAPSRSRLLPGIVDALRGNPEDLAAVAAFEVTARAELAPNFAIPASYSAQLLDSGAVAAAESWLQQRTVVESGVHRVAERRFLIALDQPDWLGNSGHLVFVEPAAEVQTDTEYQRFLDLLREIVVGGLHRLHIERSAMMQMQQQLDDRDRLYRMLFEHTAEGVAISLPDGSITAANPAACRLLGYDEAEIIELGHAGTVMDDDGSLTRSLALLAESGRYDGELRLRCRDGSVQQVDVSSVLVRDEVSGQDRIITLLRDALPRLQQQERITATARLEALGQLTGGISHDFNNLLQVITNGAEDLAAQLDAGHPGRESAELVLSASLRAAELTRQLLAFSQQRPAEPQRIDLRTALLELEQLLSRVLGHRISVHMQVLQDAEIMADPALLSSCLLNLCINARDAMPEGGSLHVTLGRQELAPQPAAAAAVASVARACVEIADTGSGIAPELLSRVVEPYFTTKPLGQGTGLGLSMVYGFVRQSGGDLQIDSTPGEGTRVRLLFPLAAAGSKSRQGAAATAAQPGSGQHVLVVEDNDLLARMLQRILQRAGYRVSHCVDVAAALKLLESDPSVALLITDILLGAGPSGWDLLDELASARPQLPVLTMSGFAPDSQGLQGSGSRQPDLSKPFRPAEVLDKVAAVLARSRPGS